MRKTKKRLDEKMIRAQELYDRLSHAMVKRKLYDTDIAGAQLRQRWLSWWKKQ